MPTKEVSGKTGSVKESIANDKPRRQEDMTKLAQKIESLGRDQAIQNLQVFLQGIEPKKREHPDLRKRRSRVKELFLKGRTQQYIAFREGISRSTVCRDLKHLRDTGEIKN